MDKSLLVINDNSPHLVEFIEPTIQEARKQGYRICSVYSGEKSARALYRIGIDQLRAEGAWWDPYPDILRVPADKVFKWAKPTAILLGIIDDAKASGAWLIEAMKHRIRAVSIGGCANYVNYFGPETLDVATKVVEFLYEHSFGNHPLKITEGTEARRKVGLVNGDILLSGFDAANVKERLGIRREQKLVVFLEDWSRFQAAAADTGRELWELYDLANMHEARLVFCPDHNTIYWQDDTEIKFPDGIVVAGYVPGPLWGREVLEVRISDLLRASDVIVQQRPSDIELLAHAVQKPMWLSKLLGEAHKPSLLGGEACYTTARELRQLIEGKLGRKGTEALHEQWAEKLNLRLDGHTAERIMNLFEQSDAWGESPQFEEPMPAGSAKVEAVENATVVDITEEVVSGSDSLGELFDELITIRLTLRLDGANSELEIKCDKIVKVIDLLVRGE